MGENMAMEQEGYGFQSSWRAAQRKPNLVLSKNLRIVFNLGSSLKKLERSSDDSPVEGNEKLLLPQKHGWIKQP